MAFFKIGLEKCMMTHLLVCKKNQLVVLDNVCKIELVKTFKTFQISLHLVLVVSGSVRQHLAPNYVFLKQKETAGNLSDTQVTPVNCEKMPACCYWDFITD